jgi:hypothetical protein
MRSNIKVMLTIFFFYSEGVVRHESLPQGKTVTKEYYLEVTERHPHQWYLHLIVVVGFESP